MSKRLLSPLLSLALGLAAVPALAAPAQQIDTRGDLHRVEAVWTGKPSMPVLRHTLVLADGSTSESVVPWTEDPFLDVDPVLAIDPARRTLFLAWSRDTGGGFAVYVSRFSASGWSTPVRVLDDPSGPEIEPQIQITASLVHVVAHNGPAYQRVCLDPDSLSIVYGPEPLPSGGAGITPGVDAPTATPTGDQVFFNSTVMRPSETDPGRVVIWGVRDEPVPIDYVEALVLPLDVVDGNLAAAVPIEGSLTLTVNTGTRIWYTLFQDASWSAPAAVALDTTITENDVRTMLADMIRRR
ncbi:MAG TPA: hypothetical protein VFV75_19190 [Candidatus Polarisedimenticolaceae bacterium]|nr:hypothetical protein [Candidatus Polarisedimenticolaceae bacterium]